MMATAITFLATPTVEGLNRVVFVLPTRVN
jgi:hypothetical protein